MSALQLPGKHPLDRLAEQYRAAVQSLLPDELVLSVGIFSGARCIADHGATTPWLVDDVALGAGTTHLVAVRYRPNGMTIETLDVLAAWDRAAITITADDDATARRLYVHADEPAAIEMRDAHQLGGFDRVNDAFYRDIGMSQFGRSGFSTPPGS